MDVVRPATELELLPVSPRLAGELVHPAHEGTLVGLQYSLEGSRIIAGAYPEGVIQVWDVADGRQLTKLETGYGYRGSAEFFHVTPDWKRVYVSRQQRNYERIEINGQAGYRWSFDGDVRGWDIESGEIVTTLKHDPPRGIIHTMFSGDGRWCITGDCIPGDYVGRHPFATSIWNVTTGRTRNLGEGVNAYGAISHDGRLAALSEQHAGENFMPGLHLFELESGVRTMSIESDANSQTYAIAFSPDDRVLLGSVTVYPEEGVWTRSRSWLKFWDVTTGEEIASIAAGEENESFGWPGGASPDGTLMAIPTQRGETTELHLIDLVQHRVVWTVVPHEGPDVFAGQTAFSPDGEWIVVTTRRVPPDLLGTLEPDVLDCPQPRIHLIRAETGETREVLVAPQSFGTGCCFSPDGKTLATSGHGKVLLWDVSNLTGASGRE